MGACPAERQNTGLCLRALDTNLLCIKIVRRNEDNYEDSCFSRRA